MRIYKMTATFGKLEHQTLTLEPGLNIITAPNEWGKSTWCAFLAAMLYGLDTRAKTTKAALADKDRYAPWSGSPMSGRIDLNWNGRDITIERRTKGRIPLGEFSAYETKSGLAVRELTAANCGQLLLGAESTVFRRTGFIRLSDLPVTQDEALRRRLNALVTTGDENGAEGRLESQLRELKNRCRYNRTGLIPQAEAQREALEAKLEELSGLEQQSRKLQLRLDEIKDWQRQLENHRLTLAWAKAESEAELVAHARDARDQAEQVLLEREAACDKLPPQEEAEETLAALRSFLQQRDALLAEQQTGPSAPLPPQTAAPFQGLSGEDAVALARKDAQTYMAAANTRKLTPLLVLGFLLLIAAAAIAIFAEPVFSAIPLGLTVLLVGIYFRKWKTMDQEARLFEQKYGSADPNLWQALAQHHKESQEKYQLEQSAYREATSDLEVRQMVLRNRRASLCGAQEPEEVLRFWQTVIAKWEAYHAARREAIAAEKHFLALNAVVKPTQRPPLTDTLTCSEAQTSQLLADARQEQQHLQNRLGQYQGRMDALGSRADLEAQLQQTAQRLEKLEDTSTALSIALEALGQARADLQRRFAPQIAGRAQQLLSQMTGSRYQKLTLDEAFSLQTGAEGEDTLRSALWRSDGTIDQLYLSLRLAAAEALMPEAPLILDDALVRFDDTRLKAVLEILKDLSKDRQVILFTCQGRESNA